MLSSNPARRAVERYWLAFTPVWGLAAAVVMVSGAAERWGDGPLLALGIAFAAGAMAPPLVRARALEPDRPWHERTATKLAASVTGLALLMNYFCTPYFFDVLHMHYGFRAAWAIDRNPIFLYLMTVAYFATYSVLVCAAYRLARGKTLSAVAGGGACLAVAGLETICNANPFTRRVFWFDDMPFMLWFGTLSYGSCFAWILPAWLAIDDEPGAPPRPLARVLVDLFAAMMAIAITFEALRRLVAPHLTAVTRSGL